MKELDNLVKIHKLKPEAPDANEFAGMVRAAETRLKDAAIVGLSVDSQFSLACRTPPISVVFPFEHRQL
ncbi:MULTISPECIES: hypothetical protein [Gammaproteobacteria]|uniref:hypothetical protein n=1 Tax=Gammaproteobacteria TaxID=1236 RepID=UPI001ADC2ADE|nr:MULTISPECIES: hypothetical protein [Gammaproteobacteria]MBO9484543.1 hypothetical protein [Salinisphaera sp. G21_0]MBO9496734.1 hypothetical protein [Thalassotalea sp. G20_0]